MLKVRRYQAVFLSAMILCIMVALSATHSVSGDMPLRLKRLILLETLGEAESRGVAIHIEMFGANDSLARLRVCKERDQLPAMVSSSLLVSLDEADDVDPSGLIMSFGQMMRLEGEGSSFDVGMFNVGSSRLGSLSIFIHQVFRDSGDSWDDGDGMLQLVIGDILGELKSEERAFNSSFDEFKCGLPSGIYSINP